ncbi:AAA-like domain-containing protein [Aerosakkonema funiforme]|uniref:AAA-like domain-containing protein n=1 Tax=Aerosakkonema funiforme TaxID=1246630 RepID=UPI0035BB5742
MRADPNLAYDYQVGGSLPLDAPTYVTRQADFDFYKHMMAAEFCYVLNSRQMGKSSLRVQMVRRLAANGVVCAVVDLTAIGSQNITPDQWYAGITYTLANSFNLLDKVDLGAWWCDREFLSPVQRLSEFICEILLKEIPQKIAIFVDEIDSVLSLNFKVDDFFALIRSCFEKRHYHPEYKRLTWALLGVATPSELIQDRSRTPFNIGQAIRLTGFQLHECFALAAGLAPKADNPKAVLKEILDWTGGKPFLTQKLCKMAISSSNFIREGAEAEAIENLVKSCIIENWEAQDEPEHLRTIRDRLLGRDPNSSKLLALYQRILLAGEIPANDTPEEMDLRLSGLIVKQQGKLRVYNNIYKLIFNSNWIQQKLAERRPYKADLEAWLVSGRLDESRFLRGEKLQAALAWAADKTLTAQDYDFLNGSQKKVLVTIKQNNYSRYDENRSTNSDAQFLYDHFLYLVQKEPPTKLIDRFRKLFIDGMGYPDPEIEAALYRIIAFLGNEQEFINLLNRCCHILINRWQLHSHKQSAIADLVALFKNSSSRFIYLASRSHLVKRLQELLLHFTASEEYHTLQRLAQVVEPNLLVNVEEVNNYLGQLIGRYPYLYTHYLLPENNSYEHRQTIREIQRQKQREYELNLAQYMPYLIGRMQINYSASSIQETDISLANPTLLSDGELYSAINEFVGKVEESYTYRDLAKVFLTRVARAKSYRAFKAELYEYLIASIETKYGKHQFNDRLYNQLKNTFPENDNQKLDEFLLMRTCSQLFNFLVESPQHSNYYLFIDMISNMGTLRTIGLLLKIVLLSSKVKPHLEKRFSLLFNYYESKTVNEILWLVKSLENLNVALVTNFGALDLSFIERNLI